MAMSSSPTPRTESAAFFQQFDPIRQRTAFFNEAAVRHTCEHRFCPHSTAVDLGAVEEESRTACVKQSRRLHKWEAELRKREHDLSEQSRTVERKGEKLSSRDAELRTREHGVDEHSKTVEEKDPELDQLDLKPRKRKRDVESEHDSLKESLHKRAMQVTKQESDVEDQTLSKAARALDQQETNLRQRETNLRYREHELEKERANVQQRRRSLTEFETTVEFDQQLLVRERRRLYDAHERQAARIATLRQSAAGSAEREAELGAQKHRLRLE